MKIEKSTRKNKKYMIKLDGKTIHFGQDGASDYIQHKDPIRKQLYINRHKKRENWKKSGRHSSGFWAKHILWNKPTSLEDNMKWVHDKFNF